MNREQLQKVRDALSEGCGWSDQILADYDEKYARHPATEADREFITDSQNKIIEALDILDAALAAPEQEPFCYVNVNAQGDITRTIKREDKWCKTPLYRLPAHQSAQPVSLETVYETIIAWDIAGKRSRRELARRMIELFTAPPSREWQDLSPLEMRDTLRNCAASTFDKLIPNWYEVRQFARAIEDALRAKNLGEQA